MSRKYLTIDNAMKWCAVIIFMPFMAICIPAIALITLARVGLDRLKPPGKRKWKVSIERPRK